MNLLPQSPSKSLSKAFLKQSVRQDEMARFKAALALLLDKIDLKESEEHL